MEFSEIKTELLNEKDKEEGDVKALIPAFLRLHLSILSFLFGWLTN